MGIMTDSITLQDYLDIIDYKICDGSNFEWKCYGPNSYIYTKTKYSPNAWDYELTIIFDTKDKTVYELEFSEYSTDLYAKWYNPVFKEAHMDEFKVKQELYGFSDDDVAVDFTDRTDDFIKLVKETINKYA